MNSPPRVFVTDSMQALASLSGSDPLARLRSNCDCRIWSETRRPGASELRRELQGCEGLLCLLSDRIDAELIYGCESLRVISSCSVGVDHVDLAAASARRVPVGHTPGVLTETTADLTFGLILAAARRLIEADGFVRRGAWQADPDWNLAGFLGADLHAATLGIVGLGPIGEAVARRAAGFGMRVIGWSRSSKSLAGIEQVPLPKLLAQSDFVSVNIALGPQTRGLLDAEAISKMKQGAVLVNTARGGIVDDLALARAVAEGHLAGAGLDVFDGEPIGPDHPLALLDRVVLTPHIGSASVRTRMRMAELSVENCLAGLEGRSLVHCANATDLS